MHRALALALGLAGCAPSAGVLPADGPHAPSAPPLPVAVSLAPLRPAPQPRPPAALRTAPAPPPEHAAHSPMAHRQMEHGQMAHGRMEHGQMAAPSGSPFGRALAAYLGVQAALASDALDGVADYARTLSDAVAQAAEAAPAGDPHFWHMRADGVAAVRSHAAALAEASELVAAREAFGRLSAAFVPLVEAHGAPDGLALARFTCGMAPGVPDGGVWLQAGDAPRNPYFGSAMLACATGRARVPSMLDGAAPADRAGHRAHGR